MRATDFLPLRVASADDILAVLHDSHRHQAVLDPEADEGALLTHQTTVADWRAACDLVAWRPLARALNRRYGTEIPLALWRAALEPQHRRTLRDVCDLLAPHVRLPAIAPFPVAGAQCRSAGAFLAFRSLLRRSGAPVEDLRPDSPLDPLLNRDPWAVLEAAGQLAPGALPTVSVTYTPAEAREFAAQLCLLLLGYALAALVPGWRLVGLLLFSLGLLWSRWRPRRGNIQLPGITTVRGLVTRLSAGPAPAV